MRKRGSYEQIFTVRGGGGVGGKSRPPKLFRVPHLAAQVRSHLVGVEFGFGIPGGGRT